MNVVAAPMHTCWGPDCLTWLAAARRRMLRFFDPYAFMLSLLVGSVGFGMTFYFDSDVQSWGMDEIGYPALAMVYVYIRNARFFGDGAARTDDPVADVAKATDIDPATSNKRDARRLDAPGVVAVSGSVPEPPAKDAVAVVFFWATWCANSKQYLPALLSTSARFRAQGVSFTGVSQEDEEDLRSFVESYSRDMRPVNVLADTKCALTNGYQAAHQVDCVPHCYIVQGTDTEAFGVVEWHGHPTRLEGVLDYLVDARLR